ncbi:MAG: glycosyltransferase family 2 protein [Candidatus Omnitrophota bacterium]
MDLTISIVNWNVKDYLKKCLSSIERHAGFLNYEVIVVDNASRDGSVAMLKEEFPQVKVIENKENVGYGSAHNQAIPLARGEFILFLNPDTEMLPETLPRAVEFMKIYPRAAALLCREIGDGRPTDETVLVMSGFGKFLWFLSQRIQSVWPNRWTAGYIVDRVVQAHRNAMQGYVFGRKELISENGFVFSRQEYIEGGFLMVRHQAIKEAGQFDPKFFLCEEGYDLTSRFKKNNWELYYLVNVRVIHYGSKCSDGISDNDLIRMEDEWRKKLRVDGGGEVKRYF